MNARRAIPVALAVGVLVMGWAQVLASWLGEPVATLTRDFQTTAAVPWYTGVIGVLTNQVWFAAAVVSVFIAWLVPAERFRLAVLGSFILVLGADDSLLLHDAVGPRHGIPQEAFLSVYAVVAVLLAALLLRGPSRGMFAAFVLGAALLSVSAAADQVLPGQHLVEDGAKLLGALVWLTVPMIACGPVRRETQRDVPPGPPGIEIRGSRRGTGT